MLKNGFLVISLDFELLWGVFDLVNYEEKLDYFKNTREVIPLILNTFEKFDVHATWAVVGMLFNNNWKEWEQNKPKDIPTYRNSSLSAYHYAGSILKSGTEDLVFAPELIKQIKATKGQEIGTHTYSHYYCRENGQNIEQFRQDLHQALILAEKMDIKIKSLVFPRNQLKRDYLKVCKELGIENVRSNPSSWYWRDVQSNTLLTKLARTGDAYISLGKKSYSGSEGEIDPGLPLEQMASRFLRPVESNSMLRTMKLKRIKNEMTLAAKNNEIYHLWWHPHNFGDNPNKSIEDLNQLLEHFSGLQKAFNYRSANMDEISKVIKSSYK
jgi:peptidoglycan/xylan/chitin deacetylase (PgdA/CDA1 family)